VQNWTIIHTKRDNSVATNFVRTFKSVGAPCGVYVNEPERVTLNNDSTTDFEKALDNVAEDTQVVVCIMPNKQKGRYDKIKQVCCVKQPVPSQCILTSTLLKKNVASIIPKIMFQINCKLGGELWRVNIPLPDTMVVGMDVCHDTGPKGGRSVVGFCASLNKDLTCYYSRVTLQDSKQEMIDGLKLCMNGAITAYFKKNKKTPKVIVVYRDGVGDGMLDTLMKHELPQYFAAFASISEDYKPRLAVVVVKKRIHTRLFMSEKPQQGRPGGPSILVNPPPGTVVDNGCTQRDWYDFFLVSQHSHEGTVTPTHYHVIYDNTGMRADHMQTLTFKLCHLYYNWPGTIRVPAPVQYAHKISFLVGQSIHQDPDVILRDKLYFL